MIDKIIICIKDTYNIHVYISPLLSLQVSIYFLQVLCKKYIMSKIDIKTLNYMLYTTIIHKIIILTIKNYML